MSVRIAGPPESPDAPALDLRLLRSRARRILAELGHARSELSILLVDDPEIARLNREHRGEKGATDVLSFSLVEGENADFRGCLLGDVVIGVCTARRQARMRHRALDSEVARLLIHGALHLLGHDHREAEETRRMRAEERRLWRAIEG